MLFQTHIARIIIINIIPYNSLYYRNTPIFVGYIYLDNIPKRVGMDTYRYNPVAGTI